MKFARETNGDPVAGIDARVFAALPSHIALRRRVVYGAMMQYLPVVCLALVGLLAASCSSDPEDRAFFGTGWVKPEAGANKRLEQNQTLVPIKNEYDRAPTQAPPDAGPAPKPSAADQ